MAVHALVIDSSTDVISWDSDADTIDVSGNRYVLAITVATDVVYWTSDRPDGTTERVLTIESTTDVVSWLSSDSLTWTV